MQKCLPRESEKNKSWVVYNDKIQTYRKKLQGIQDVRDITRCYMFSDGAYNDDSRARKRAWHAVKANIRNFRHGHDCGRLLVLWYSGTYLSQTNANVTTTYESEFFLFL